MNRSPERVRRDFMLKQKRRRIKTSTSSCEVALKGFLLKLDYVVREMPLFGSRPNARYLVALWIAPLDLSE
jgi:hypothetical protein